MENINRLVEYPSLGMLTLRAMPLAIVYAGFVFMFDAGIVGLFGIYIVFLSGLLRYGLSALYKKEKIVLVTGLVVASITHVGVSVQIHPLLGISGLLIVFNIILNGDITYREFIRNHWPISAIFIPIGIIGNAILAPVGLLSIIGGFALLTNRFRRKRASKQDGSGSESGDRRVTSTERKTDSTRSVRKTSWDRSGTTAGSTSFQSAKIPNLDSTASPPPESLSYQNIEKVEQIGRGGNANVYRATARTASGTRTIALKEPRVQGTIHAEVINRFETEARTWQQIDDHNHIVGVVDYGTNHFPWIALEYMDGGNLASVADDMGIPAKRWTATKTTEAVLHAHHHGVVHLDLKPENVMLRSTPNGTFDVPKIGDWGLAKLLLEHSKSIEGYSPQYAAPEQFDPDNYGSPDTYTDIYQLGVIFYELFTGQPPFQGQTGQVMYAVLNEEPRPPSEIADVPPELDDLLLPALAKEKEDRYESVLYIRDGLQELPFEERSRI